MSNEKQLREFYANFVKYSDIESTDDRSCGGVEKKLHV